LRNAAHRAGIGFDRLAGTCSKTAMSKALSLVILAMMVVQIIKPLGLPGLRQRSDFWKLAVAALVAISLTVIISHATV